MLEKLLVRHAVTSHFDFLKRNSFFLNPLIGIHVGGCHNRVEFFVSGEMPTKGERLLQCDITFF